MNNLDMLAAQHAQKIIAKTIEQKQKKSDVENVVTKALGVIQEQGIYAGMLYLLSRPKKEEMIAGAARDELVALLKAKALRDFKLDKDLIAKPDSQQLLDHFAKEVCSKPIPTLLLIKNLFEQTLMYARYSAKARPDDDKKKELSGNGELAQEN